MRFLQTILRIAREKVQDGKPVRTDSLVLPMTGTWEASDRDNLKRFLESPTGRALVQRLRATEAANAIAGAKELEHTEHAAGVTVGYGQAVEHLISLSRACRVKQAHNDIGALKGEAPADESAREDRELAELLGRLSP